LSGQAVACNCGRWHAQSICGGIPHHCSYQLRRERRPGCSLRWRHVQFACGAGPAWPCLLLAL
jgi:hypothetical protein